MELGTLQIIWFFLYGVLITGYAILDGFDLGVGVLHLFAKSEEERRININAIGPVWDGNEVWLLTAGGALFAAFPPVYATVFSGFYLALMLVLLALILRAVSMEFRGHVESDKWRSVWDFAFGLGSLLPAILFGVAVGNLLRGIPLDENGIFTGTFFGLLNPFSLLIGILSLVMFVKHGAIYMVLKTKGELKDRMNNIASKAWTVFVVLFILATIYAFFEAPYLFEGMLSNALFWLFFILLIGSIIATPTLILKENEWKPFVSSSITIAALIGVTAVGMFPKLVPAIGDMSRSLTITNSSSTAPTLSAMLIIALIGMPIVIGYTIFIYRIFWGKVEITEESY
ncbi:MAG: cytochrome d ubiquinol oxidase subunit II [Candidatus Marinimicrobia bacterium]|nr:cytochrome d ubiquinol oxidase subunit II [Candidatus Neomarinimicrobiota bacterium]MBL6964591.1 cytochrome d ubiquinol oxidase subunit II [Bacteroidota bacterium]